MTRRGISPITGTLGSLAIAMALWQGHVASERIAAAPAPAPVKAVEEKAAPPTDDEHAADVLIGYKSHR